MQSTSLGKSSSVNRFVLLYHQRAAASASTGSDAYVTNEDTALVVSAANGVLANDSDPNGDPLSAVVVNQPTNGEDTENRNSQKVGSSKRVQSSVTVQAVVKPELKMVEISYQKTNIKILS